jgi:hypothetical protein
MSLAFVVIFCFPSGAPLALCSPIYLYLETEEEEEEDRNETTEY